MLDICGCRDDCVKVRRQLGWSVCSFCHVDWGMEPSHVEGKGAKMELPSNTRAMPLSDSDGISNKKPS